MPVNLDDLSALDAEIAKEQTISEITGWLTKTFDADLVEAWKQFKERYNVSIDV